MNAMKYLHALACCCSRCLLPRRRGRSSPTRCCRIRLWRRAPAPSPQELRCMVCQNESIDDSQAPLAHDLRVLVRQRIMAGDSDQQIINFLVSRYGEFVLLKPPLSWNTLALVGRAAGAAATRHCDDCRRRAPAPGGRVGGRARRNSALPRKRGFPKSCTAEPHSRSARSVCLSLAERTAIHA